MAFYHAKENPPCERVLLPFEQLAKPIGQKRGFGCDCITSAYHNAPPQYLIAYQVAR
jgi:hypothetical protein